MRYARRTDEIIDGKAQRVARLTWLHAAWDSHPSAMVYLDKTTNLVTRIVRTVADHTSTTDLGDYRKFRGRWIPYHRTITDADGVLDLVVEKIELDPKDIERESFAHPW